MSETINGALSPDQKNAIESFRITGVIGSIVSAYIGNPNIRLTPNEVQTLIKDTYQTLSGLAQPSAEPAPVQQKPAVPISKSVTPDYLVCLEDGKKYKSLKRTLRTQYNLTPEQYREKWGLPKDYPMVAPNYSATRSQLAKDHGLGKKV